MCCRQSHEPGLESRLGHHPTFWAVHLLPQSSSLEGGMLGLVLVGMSEMTCRSKARQGEVFMNVHLLSFM